MTKQNDISFIGFIFGILNLLIITPWYSGIFEEIINKDSVYFLGIGIILGGLIIIFLSILKLKINKQIISYLSFILIFSCISQLLFYKYSLINNLLYIFNGILEWINLFLFYIYSKETMIIKFKNSRFILNSFYIIAISLVLIGYISLYSYYFINFGTFISTLLIYAGIYADLNNDKLKIYKNELNRKKRFFSHLFFILINIIISSLIIIKFSEIKELVKINENFNYISQITFNLFIINAIAILIFGILINKNVKLLNGCISIIIGILLIYLILISNPNSIVLLIFSAILESFSIISFITLISTNHFKFFDLFLITTINLTFIFFGSDITPIWFLIKISRLILLIISSISLILSFLITKFWSEVFEK